MSTPGVEKLSENVLLPPSVFSDPQCTMWSTDTSFCHRRHTASSRAAQVLPLSLRAAHTYVRPYGLSDVSQSPAINYEGVSKNVTAVGFQEDGKWMFTGGEDCTAKIWDLRSRNLQISRIFQVSAPVNCACLHPNQAELFVGDASGVIHIWDVKTEHNEQLIPEPDASIQSIAIDPEGTYMAAVNNKGKVYVWRLSGGTADNRITLTPTRSIVAHSKYALKVKFSPDSTMLVTSSADRTAKIWKTADFSQMTELRDPGQQWVWDVAFSADSQHIITGTRYRKLYILALSGLKRVYYGEEYIESGDVLFS
ncbi:unnamed protein product, partial [Meganyctiphanes norvegica]